MNWHRPSKPGQRLVDAHEDLLADVLGERPVAGEHARHVVEDRPVVLPDDDRERTLVASTSESQDIGIWLRKGQSVRAGAKNPREYRHPAIRMSEGWAIAVQRIAIPCQASGPAPGSTRSAMSPFIAAGAGTPSRSSIGRRDVGQPAPLAEREPLVRGDQRHGVRRVGRVRRAVGVQHRLGVAVVGGDEADAAASGDGLGDAGQAAVGRLDRLDRPPGSRPCGRPCRGSRS